MGVCNQPKTTFWTHAFCAETSCRKCLLYYLLFRFILFQVGDFHFSLVFEAEIDHLTRCPTIPIFKNLAPCTLTKGVSGKQVLKLLHQVRASVPRCWCSQVDQWRRRRNVTSQQNARITVQRSEKFQTWSSRWDTAESQLCEGSGRDFGDYTAVLLAYRTPRGRETSSELSETMIHGRYTGCVLWPVSQTAGVNYQLYLYPCFIGKNIHAHIMWWTKRSALLKHKQ